MKFWEVSSKNKFGIVGVNEVMKWILYLLLMGVGVAIIRNIFLRLG